MTINCKRVFQPNSIAKMSKSFANFAFYSAFIFFLLVGKVVSRDLHYNDLELVSDGVSNRGEDESILHQTGVDSSEEQCIQQYGILPCSNSIWGNYLLIILYEYLLYIAESYAGDATRICGVLGKNVFSSILLQLIDSLPDSLILLSIGLLSTKEKAEEYMVIGAGLLAGSSLYLLTINWGLCFIVATKFFNVQPGSQVTNQGIKVKLTGSGVVTDAETRYHAKVMLFSLIPFVVNQLPSVFGYSYSSKEHKIGLLLSLFASIICLISYFSYQFYDPRIWRRRLEFAEVEHKLKSYVPLYDVQALMLDREKRMMIRKKEMLKKLKYPEANEETMRKEEFVDMFEEWVDVTISYMDDPYSSDYFERKQVKVEDPLQAEKKKSLDMIWLMMERASGRTLLKEDGTQDESAIDSLFDYIDADKDGFVTQIELENFILDNLIDDEAVGIMMIHFGINENEDIDKGEFRSRVIKWLSSLRNWSQDGNEGTDLPLWPEIKEKFKTYFEISKLLCVVLPGMIILGLLSEPMVECMTKLAESAETEPIYMYILYFPLATNMRKVIAAGKAANLRRHHTNCLVFSEIYNKVFLNNILGFSVLVLVIYFRGLTWHYTAEIQVVIIVCTVMGLLAIYMTKIPFWTIFIALELYPLSLIVLCYINNDFW